MSANNVFIVGQVARISVITKEGAVNADPTVIVLKIKRGTDAVVTYTSASEYPVVKDGVGLYHIDLPLDTTGSYKYRWEGTGLTKGAGEGSFIVKESALS